MRMKKRCRRELSGVESSYTYWTCEWVLRTQAGLKFLLRSYRSLGGPACCDGPVCGTWYSAPTEAGSLFSPTVCSPASWCSPSGAAAGSACRPRRTGPGLPACGSPLCPRRPHCHSSTRTPSPPRPSPRSPDLRPGPHLPSYRETPLLCPPPTGLRASRSLPETAGPGNTSKKLSFVSTGPRSRDYLGEWEPEEDRTWSWSSVRTREQTCSSASCLPDSTASSGWTLSTSDFSADSTAVQELFLRWARRSGPSSSRRERLHRPRWGTPRRTVPRAWRMARRAFGPRLHRPPRFRARLRLGWGETAPELGEPGRKSPRRTAGIGGAPCKRANKKG